MDITVAISTISDGTMSILPDKSNQPIVIQNRDRFLMTHHIPMKDTTLVKVTYGGHNYTRYKEVGSAQKGDGMYNGEAVACDALITRERRHALFLPLADCVGMVVYDPDQHILMLSHVGRHSLEQNGAHESVQWLVTQYQSNPASLLVWLTPAPGQASYPVWAFGNGDFKEIVLEQLDQAGISASHITNDSSDSTTDPRYFSHSEFLAGRQTEDGRYALVSMMH